MHINWFEGAYQFSVKDTFKDAILNTSIEYSSSKIFFSYVLCSLYKPTDLKYSMQNDLNP